MYFGLNRDKSLPEIAKGPRPSKDLNIQILRAKVTSNTSDITFRQDLLCLCNRYRPVPITGLFARSVFSPFLDKP